MSSKISKELQELVDSNKLSEDEAKLIHEVREGNIENPIKEKEEVIDIHEINESINKANEVIETSKNLIEKLDKAIVIINQPDTMLFNYEEFLSPDDKSQLSILTEDLKEKFEERIEGLKESVESLKELKEYTIKYADNVKHLFNQSPEVNDEKIKKALEHDKSQSAVQKGDDLETS